MKKIKKFSLADLDLLTLKHELFFQFLRVSPSYQYVHAVKTGEISKKIPKNNRHLNKVIDTYNLIGDVFNTDFPAWWETRGHSLFFGKDYLNLFVKLDLSKSSKQEIFRVGQLIEQSFEKYKSDEPRVRLEKNKIRLSTLQDRMNFLTEKAADSMYDSPKRPGWVLLDLSEQIQTKHSLSFRTKKSSLNSYERIYLTMLSSKYLHDALVLSENAALGIFPSFNKNQSEMKFDFWAVGELEGREAKYINVPKNNRQFESEIRKHLYLLRIEESEKKEINKRVNRVRKPIKKSYKEYKKAWKLI